MLDKDFQKWFAEFNISQSYEEPSGKIRAREIMSMWTNKHGELNTFSTITN